MARRRVLLALLVAPAAAWLLLELCFPLPVARLRPPPSTVVLDRRGDALRAFVAPDGAWRIETPLARVSPAARDLVVDYEDRRFRRHPGVDPVALARALAQDVRAARIVSGGSTIPMQLARLMEPKARTPWGKAWEMFRAFQIERKFTKDEILELYLNRAPYGGNLEGIGAAGWFYFGRRPEQLSLAQAALLASLPNSPSRTRPDRYPDAARAARDKVLRVLHRRGRIPDAAYREALAEPAPRARGTAPVRAPHAGEMARALRPGEGTVRTTIDPAIQEAAEGIIRRHAARLRPMGIDQVAAVVLDVATGDVLALVGSVDFADAARWGQVNGATSPRSPGSALKPFVYALALDRGLVTPSMKLADVPVEYGTYAPENFDGTYRGVARMTEALTESLNVPAVNLAAKLGRDGLYAFLKRADVRTLRPRETDYGLSMVLGGCEIDLLELTALYAALARGGTFLPARLVADAPRPEARLLVSPAAAYLISDVLSQTHRPDFPDVWQAAPGRAKLAYKTGTSYGHGDAWAVGYHRRYAVGVWAGNFPGRGAPDLTGATAAAPVLFDLFHALPGASSTPWFTAPPEVGLRAVCPLSGLPAGPDCPERKLAFYVRDVSPDAPCNVHVAHEIDDRTGKRLCARCRAGRARHRRVFVQWPAEVATWLARSGNPPDVVPEHDPNCPAMLGGFPPRIKSPAAGCEYVVRDGAPLQYQKIKLEASVAGDAGAVFWFVDGTLVAHGPPTDDVFVEPVRGVHEVVCADDLGRSSKVPLVVR